MPYYYHAFGLNIASDIECPGLSPGHGPVDVSIAYGAVPRKIEDPRIQHSFYDLKPNQVLIRMDEVAYFLVENGNSILIDRSEGTNEEVLRLYLLGVVFSGLLHQRGLLPLHGSAVETPKGVVVFVGDPGVGKSTLAGALCARKYHLFTDDILVVSCENNIPTAYPGFPEMKMTPETADRLGVDTASARKLSWYKEKYIVSARDHFAGAPQPLYGVYWLTKADVPTITLRPVEGVDKFKMLIANTFRASFMEGLGVNANHFKLATVVGRQVRLIRVTRPDEGFHLTGLMDTLEQDFLTDNM